jgi:hypothetical protein
VGFVTHLEVALLVDEEVLRLEVAVEDAAGVKVRESEEELRHEFLRNAGETAIRLERLFDTQA